VEAVDEAFAEHVEAVYPEIHGFWAILILSI